MMRRADVRCGSKASFWKSVGHFGSSPNTDIARAAQSVRLVPKGDIGRYLAIRQPNSTTAAPTAAAMTDVTIPPLSASSPAI